MLGALCFWESERDPGYLDLIEKKILEMGWGNGKKFAWAESGICVFACDRKKNSFEITVIVFKAYKCIRNVKAQNFLSFFLYFRDCPKNCEGNKQKRRRKYVRMSN